MSTKKDPASLLKSYMINELGKLASFSAVGFKPRALGRPIMAADRTDYGSTANPEKPASLSRHETSRNFPLILKPFLHPHNPANATGSDWEYDEDGIEWWICLVVSRLRRFETH